MLREDEMDTEHASGNMNVQFCQCWASTVSAGVQVQPTTCHHMLALQLCCYLSNGVLVVSPFHCHSHIMNNISTDAMIVTFKQRIMTSESAIKIVGGPVSVVHAIVKPLPVLLPERATVKLLLLSEAALTASLKTPPNYTQL